jgi:hypothetical protein
MYKNLVTKNQLNDLFHAWNVHDDIPNKNNKVIINFAPDAQFRVGIARWTDKKSDVKERLYSIVLADTFENADVIA